MNELNVERSAMCEQVAAAYIFHALNSPPSPLRPVIRRLIRSPIDTELLMSSFLKQLGDDVLKSAKKHSIVDTLEKGAAQSEFRRTPTNVLCADSVPCLVRGLIDPC